MKLSVADKEIFEKESRNFDSTNKKIRNCDSLKKK